MPGGSLRSICSRRKYTFDSTSTVSEGDACWFGQQKRVHRRPEAGSAGRRVSGAPNQGRTVTVNTYGNVSYTPKRRFKGVETFGYTVKDSLGATSNTATVTVTAQ